MYSVGCGRVCRCVAGDCDVQFCRSIMMMQFIVALLAILFPFLGDLFTQFFPNLGG